MMQQPNMATQHQYMGNRPATGNAAPMQHQQSMVQQQDANKRQKKAPAQVTARSILLLPISRLIKSRGLI
jgi:predicted component of type VI protein secretion system